MNVRIVLGLVLSALIGFAMLSSRQVVALDFRAFYCSGMALREGHDPYRTQYLRACEAGATDESYVQMLSTVTLPAPQPTYDIAFFSLASLLPFALAKAFWGALIAASMFVAALTLIRLTRASPTTTLAVLAISLMGISISLGQIVPLYFAAACTAALLLKQGKPQWAGAAAALTLVEPHLGLPLCVSLALWERRSRLPLALGAGTLAVLGLATAGLNENLEYFRTVLPLHALSELDSDGQLSLSVILHALGMTGARAVQIGNLSYLAVNAIGVWAARPAALALQSPALLAALPAATAVVGGSFMHSTEIVAAIPLALLLVPQPRYRAVFAGALVLLAIPWLTSTDDPGSFIGWYGLCALSAGYILRVCAGLGNLASAACAAVVFAALCEMSFSYQHARALYMHTPHAALASIDERYPQASWARIVHETFATQSAPAWLLRAPTWARLVLLLGGTAAVTFRRPLPAVSTQSTPFAR